MAKKIVRTESIFSNSPADESISLVNSYPQVCEYAIAEYDVRASQKAGELINAHAALGWRLIAAAGDVTRTLYFEREIRP